MALDPYTLCPGGKGEKIKFCCADLLHELEKIGRLQETGQNQACLDLVTKLDQKHPDRACLMTVRADLLRRAGRFEEAQAAAKSLLEKQADNPVALAEMAIVTCQQDGGPAAVPLVQRAMAACKSDSIPPQVAQAMGMLAMVLLSDEYVEAGRYYLANYCAMNPEDKGAAQTYLSLSANPAIPLLQRDSFSISTRVAEPACQKQLDAVMEDIYAGRLLPAEEKLTAIAAKFPKEPAVWQHLAGVRAHLVDQTGAAEAWRRLAACDVPLDDAVEAEARAQLDSIENDDAVSLAVVQDAPDVERLIELLSASEFCISAPELTEQTEEGVPPPKAAFRLLDKPSSPPGTVLPWRELPSQIGTLVIFGRETDREARLQWVARKGAEFDRVKAFLRDLAFGLFGAASEPQAIEVHPWPEALLEPRWAVFSQLAQGELASWIEEFRVDAIEKTFLSQPRVALGGKPLEQAAREPALRVPALAVILLLQLHADCHGLEYDFNALRQRLGLPLPAPIPAAGLDAKDLTVAKYFRVNVAELSDEQLEAVSFRAMSHRIVNVMRKAVQEMLARPSVTAKVSKAELLGILSDSSPTIAEKLRYLDEARNAAEADKKSSAPWDMRELQLRLVSGDEERAQFLLNHLMTEHRREPGVQNAVMQLMVQMGIISPDGVPLAPMGTPSASQRILATPGGEAPAEPGKIWTPESARGEKKSLWIPD